MVPALPTCASMATFSRATAACFFAHILPSYVSALRLDDIQLHLHFFVSPVLDRLPATVVWPAGIIPKVLVRNHHRD
eukprot:6184556-Pleurochrysis_carterae.AAC.3